MTDRELLEAAAKAAGLALVDGEHGDMLRVYYTDPHTGLNRYTPWNPLTDDGDALRLAAALGLVVDCSRPSAGRPFYSHEFRELDATSTIEGVRRAIVRAAAEIGKGL